MVGDATTSPIGPRLFDMGWRQGGILAGSPLQLAYNQRGSEGDQQAGPASGVMLFSRPLRADECLIIVSQDCDIIADVGAEPYIEALVCYTESDPDVRNNWDRNSARHFVVDPDSGLVARATDRVTMSKNLALGFTPTSWPSDPKRLERFVRWLGRRYDRPAIPDPIVSAFQRPLNKVLGKIGKTTMASFTAAVHEIRISLPPIEIPPFAINVVLMARRDDTLSEQEADAIEAVEAAIRAALDPDLVALGDFALRLEAEMAVAEYFATRPLFLEYLTYKGTEIRGAEPFPRV